MENTKPKDASLALQATHPDALIGCVDSSLPTPSFCVDVDVATANTVRMAEKARKAGMLLRPHVKTHKTLEGAALQTAHAAKTNDAAIVVSTIAEARAFASSGFSDILYGICIEPSKLPYLWELHTTPGMRLRVMIDSAEAWQALQTWWEGHGCGRPWSVYLKVDAGYRRAGVDPASDAAVELAAALARCPSTSLHGLYAHSGNSYNCCPAAEGQTPAQLAADIGRNELASLLEFARRLHTSRGIAVPVVSVGASPSTSAYDYALAHAAAAAENSGTGDGPTIEIHPGNYIFYDRQQCASGSCERRDIACYVVARVIGRYPERGELLIDAGSCALHKDSGGLKDGTWGELLDHAGHVLVRMTQEAAVVARTDGQPLDFAAFPLGAVVRVLPNHSCMTASGHPAFFAVQTEVAPQPQRVVRGVWRPVKYWY